MGFYLAIDRDTIRWGGVEKIASTYAHVSSSTAYTFISESESISQPIGAWVLGTSVRAHYVASKLRLSNVWRDSDLVTLAGDNDVVIVVLINDRRYVYRRYARVYANMDLSGCDVWRYNVSESDVYLALRGNHPPSWSSYVTNYTLT